MKVKYNVIPLHTMKVYGGVENVAPLISPGNVCGEWSASRPVHSTPREGPPDVQQIEDAVGRRDGLDFVREER